MDLCPKIMTTSSANGFSLKPASHSRRRHSTGASYCLGHQEDRSVLTSSDKPLFLTEVAGKQRDVNTQNVPLASFISLSFSLLHCKAFACDNA